MKIDKIGRTYKAYQKMKYPRKITFGRLNKVYETVQELPVWTKVMRRIDPSRDQINMVQAEKVKFQIKEIREWLDMAEQKLT